MRDLMLLLSLILPLLSRLPCNYRSRPGGSASPALLNEPQSLLTMDGWSVFRSTLYSPPPGHDSAARDV